jgi:putative endonuclease
VVVVEVKQRKSAAYGHPAELIDGRKLQRLRTAALHYLSYVLLRPDSAWRIDAVLVLGTERYHRLQHLENVA